MDSGLSSEMTNTYLEHRALARLLGRSERFDRQAIVDRMRELDHGLWVHASLVAETAGRLADRLRIHGQARTLLIDAAWVHDVGKLTVSRTILDKPGPLDSAEWAEMREHPARAADFLSSSPGMVEVAPLVRHHHERYDGTGYPGRLAAESIPLGARIICVVDAFDAMTSERAYRTAMPVDAALSELRRCSGTQFDPVVTEAFLWIASR